MYRANQVPLRSACVLRIRDHVWYGGQHCLGEENDRNIPPAVVHPLRTRSKSDNANGASKLESYRKSLDKAESLSTILISYL